MDGSSQPNTQTKQNKDSNNLNHTQKHMSIVIFIILGLFFIGYMIYAFIAYVNSWFPFDDYVVTPPPNTAQPTGQVEPLSAQEQANAQSLVNQALQNNCNYYCEAANPKYNSKYPLLPKNQKPLGDCDCSTLTPS